MNENGHQLHVLLAGAMAWSHICSHVIALARQAMRVVAVYGQLTVVHCRLQIGVEVLVDFVALA